MLFGPDEVLACPHCGAPVRAFTLRTANGYGFSTWTDGFAFNSMCWTRPEVSRCRACNRFYWTEDAPSLGMMPPKSFQADDLPWPGEGGSLHRRPEPTAPPPEEWAQAPSLAGLDAREHRMALESGMASTPEQFVRLRLLTFWCSNHRNRNPRKKKVRQKEPWETQNLRTLLEDRTRRFAEGRDPADALAVAEMHRELGEFPACLSWLQQVDPAAGLEPFTAEVARLAREGQVVVSPVGAGFPPDDWARARRFGEMMATLARSAPDASTPE